MSPPRRKSSPGNCCSPPPPRTCSLFEMHLAALGLKVTAAVNDHDAVEAIPARPYSCIIMDMQMAVLDGYSAARAIARGAGTLAGDGVHPSDS